MSIIGNCIKTGACVHFIEYGQYFVCDLFAVGDAVVIHFTACVFGNDSQFKPSRPVTHEVYVGNDYLDKRAGYAVVRASNCKPVGEDS